MAKDRDQVTQFWHNLEVELAEPILIYSMGRCYDPPGIGRVSLWGVFFLTPTAFYFMHFAQASWFAILTNRASRLRRHKLTLRVPRNCMIGLRQDERPRFWRRFWSRDLPAVRVEYLDGEGRSRTLRFTLEKDRSNFLSLLDTRSMFRR